MNTARTLVLLTLFMVAGTVEAWAQTQADITDIDGLNAMTADGSYIIKADIDASSYTASIENFSGTLEAAIDPETKMPYRIKNLGTPLFTTLTGTVRNLVIGSVNISGHEGYTGAIACTATGSARIYNVGILAGSVGGTGYTGGLVALLDGEARVINCYSYADITDGTNVGGIVGYNNVATASNNLKTMVFACMFYGDITGGEDKAPIYNGKIISNTGDTGVNNFNYFRAEASYVQNRDIQTYNCALLAETRFLQRFEFFRHLLNSNRELAAWWVTGDRTKKEDIMKWVMEPSQIGSSTPYPILKEPGRYPSVVNYQIDNGTCTAKSLGTLNVTIRMGSGGAVYEPPSGAAISKTSLTLNITDKDPDHFNFNYYKVQLPYYNDVGSGNYTGNRVVTGWKIVSITGGTPGSYTTGPDATTDADGNITAAPYNFADRNCTNKDLYGTNGSNRVFNQGAYWDVPEGVTAITIEPYWARCTYLADAYADVVYKSSMATAVNVSYVGGGQVYASNPTSCNIAGESQNVYTNSDNARSNLGLDAKHTVYDHAIVLVGNFHKHNGVTSGNNSGHLYTIMSADFDHDNEPDYCYIHRYDGRTPTHPVRIDFLNVPGLGMAQKSTGSTGSYNAGIMQPIGWFETTNTSLFRVTQFEYDRKERGAAPLILQGGVIEQWVSDQNNDVANLTTYFHVGGNVWFKEFHRGTHQDKSWISKHPPISVTGGDFDEFYLTGLYTANVVNYDDNAECYINGGRFGIVAGAGMEGIGNASTHTNGNIFWQIQNADIGEFYGGGINADKIVEGNITTVITGSRVGTFCGGPKFGDMNTGKTVITTATDCTFGTYFGAGYGGNSYSRQAPQNHSGITNFPHNQSGAGNHASWNEWLEAFYTQSYNSTYGGVSTQFSYQFLPMSDNKTNVARIFVEYVKFSKATTCNVTSKLTGCTVTGNFYGGGSLGKVDGPVTSTLTDCAIQGSVYGAGYSASLPTVEVDSIGFRVEPFYYTNLGTYRYGVKGVTTTYTWEHRDQTINNTNLAIDKTNHILYTNEDLTTLGTVTGQVTLNIDGSTTVTGSVYGGGESSNVGGSVEVNMQGGTIAKDVYGGGALANVSGETKLLLLGGTVNGNVYGGGKGRLESGTSGNADYVSPIEATVGAAKVNLNGMETGDYNAEAYGDLVEAVKNDGENIDYYCLKAKDAEEHAITGCVVKGAVFGCNNLNGTPLGNATVHVYKTQGYEGHWRTKNDPDAEGGNPIESIDDSKHSYELSAVYGGGNLAAYDPTDASNKVARVIVDGCGLTSIKTVYGGGNAASTPATQVEINGTYEIEEVFGGGNGKDRISRDGGSTYIANPGANVGYRNYTVYDTSGNPQDATDATTPADRTTNYGYGTGQANVNIHGGLIHRVYGGSNTKGNVRQAALTMLEDANVCEFSVEQAYGGGKSAPMDGSAHLEMACIPGLKVAYGGAESADIQNNVTLNITNGNFDRVFGGNNVSGTISGTITVNVEETGCKPVIIGQLYGGGNQAAYSAPFVAGSTTVRQPGPTLNVRSFTSIGEIYGGGYGKTAKITGDTYVNVNVCDGQDFSADETKTKIITDNTDKTRTISFSEYVRTDNGGFETDTDGNRLTTKQTVSVYMPGRSGLMGGINTIFGGGNAAEVDGNTHVNIGTQAGSEITFATPAAQDEASRKHEVKGANIVGNVYGGGNNAEVTGNANVQIGKRTDVPSPAPAATTDSATAQE